MDQYHFARPVISSEVGPTNGPEKSATPGSRRTPFQWINKFITPPVPIGWRIRLAWMIVAVICAGTLGLATRLPPNARGFGTHEALGLYPCGFVLRTGLPCPTCGMTTAFSHMMHGQVGRAFIVQPAGALLCFGTAVMLALSVTAAWRGRMVNLRWAQIDPVRVSLCIGIVFLGSWGFKVAIGLLTGDFRGTREFEWLFTF